MQNKRFISITLAVTAAGMLGGCVTKPPPPPPPPPPAPTKPVPPPYTWNGTGAAGPSRIVVDVSKQRAFFFRGATMVGETRCSTGKKGFETACGAYQVAQKDKNHVSNLYGSFVNGAGKIVKRDVDMSKMKVPEGCAFQGAKMPFFLRFTAGYGLHAGHVPDYPASHGCVRLPRPMAEHFFENSEIGTPVVIRE